MRDPGAVLRGALPLQTLTLASYSRGSTGCGGPLGERGLRHSGCAQVAIAAEHHRLRGGDVVAVAQHAALRRVDGRIKRDSVRCKQAHGRAEQAPRVADSYCGAQCLLDSSAASGAFHQPIHHYAAVTKVMRPLTGAHHSQG